MPDARTMHSPYPSGQGAASVPVLFTLPNVQPVIAAASVKPEGVARAASTAAELERTNLEGTNSVPNTSLNTHAGSAAGSVNPSISSTYAKKSPGAGSKIGHITNALIGVLLLAVVSLTIRNFAPTKSVSANNQEPSNSTASLTNSSPATSPSDAQSAAISASVSTGTHTNTAPVLIASKSGDIRHTDAAIPGSGGMDAPADSISSVSEKNGRSSATREASAESSEETPESGEENLAGTTTSGPSVPRLLQSKEPKPALGGGATLQYPQPANDGAAVATGPYGTNAATIPAANTPELSITSSSNVATSTPDLKESAATGSPQPRGSVSLTSGPNRYAGNSSTGIPNAVDSDTPSLNTRDMINLRNGQRSAKGIVGGTTTVRNPAARGQEAMNPTQSMLMSGETYPPIRKQYEPINIPSNGTQAPAAYQPVYQQALQPNTAQPNTAQPNTAQPNTAQPNTAAQPGGLTNGQGIATSGNVITQPRVPYSGSALSAGSPTNAAPNNTTQQRPLQPYTPLTPTLPMPDGSGLAPTTPNR